MKGRVTKMKVFIDPGHGGKDPGAVGNGLREKDVTLEIAKLIQSKLSNYATVRLSRTSDRYISVSERARSANNWGADLFVSVHINAGGGTGYEDYIYNGLSNASRTAKIRDVIHSEIVNQMSAVRDRGKKKANFAVLRETRMPAVLTENLFIDTKADAELLKDSSFLNRIATGHVNGIVKALNLDRSTKSSENPSTEDTSSTATESASSTIEMIQRTLNRRYGFNIAEDNKFGPETKRALVKAYQIELNEQFNAGLVVDGIFGTKTYNASVNVGIGARGNLTWILQAALRCRGYRLAVDGIFGNETQRVVRQFQSDSNITVDGIAGRNTFRQLLT